MFARYTKISTSPLLHKRGSQQRPTDLAFFFSSSSSFFFSYPAGAFVLWRRTTWCLVMIDIGLFDLERFFSFETGKTEWVRFRVVWGVGGWFGFASTKYSSFTKVESLLRIIKWSRILFWRLLGGMGREVGLKTKNKKQTQKLCNAFRLV